MENSNTNKETQVKTINAPEYMNSPPELMTTVPVSKLRQNGYAMIQGHPCIITYRAVSMS